MKQSWLVWMLLALIWLAMAGFMASSAEFRTWLDSRNAEHSDMGPKRHEFPGRDPAIGSRIGLPASDIYDRKIEPSNSDSKVLIAYLANRSACRKDAIAPELLPFEDFDLVIVVHSDLSEVDNLKNLLPENARILMDEAGNIGKSLNASAPPRYYLLSGELRLLEVQQFIGALPRFVNYEEPQL